MIKTQNFQLLPPPAEIRGDEISRNQDWDGGFLKTLSYIATVLLKFLSLLSIHFPTSIYSSVGRKETRVRDFEQRKRAFFSHSPPLFHSGFQFPPAVDFFFQNALWNESQHLL